jgi:2-polyprenyl-3-methyl-5-hydroxy-6-metoxy-1,4-benzoquinol methylase
MSPGLLSDQSDKSWEIHGRNEAYYGVLSDARYRAKNLSQAVLAEFMQSGEDHIDEILGVVQHYFGPLGRHSRALDFGCGVGRLVIPLARRFDDVTGIDISPAMLEEAHLNAARANLDNIRFAQSLDDLVELGDTFDFVHSVIVLQHIPVQTGTRILSQLATLLAPGGVAAIHVSLKLRRPLWRKIGSSLRRHIDLLRIPANLVNRRPWNEPMMQMNEYSLDSLFSLLTGQGIERILVQRSGSDPTLQAFLFFMK